MLQRALLLLCAILIGFPSIAGAAERPNLILLLADDLVYADLSSFSSTAVRTPHIDRLAAGGMKFTQFYAASAVCTPTRASVLTGRYPLRFDIHRHFPDDESHLPRGVVIRENTLILFTSDNGAAYEGQIGDLKGGKTDLHEGGIRVPMVINWPSRISAGKSSDTLAHTNDILPTFCAAAEVQLPDDASIDGINLLPHILDGKPVTDEQRGTVFWQLDLYKHLQRHYPKPKPYSTEVARRGRWKLLCLDGEPQELFDIEADAQETNNLLDVHRQVAVELAVEVRAFLDEPRQSWNDDP